jgi:hypothetical protein
MTGSILRPLAAIVALALAACSDADGRGPGPAAGEKRGGTVFLVQREPQDAVMEALYEGKVVRDAQGCLRIEGADSAAVVWPYGFTLEERGEDLQVKDGAGRVVGRIGGTFKFGGGHVPPGNYAFLPEAERATAAARCPGDVWIVGDTDVAS